MENIEAKKHDASFFEVRQIVSDFIIENFKNKGRIVELQKKETGWIACIEIIEESDYVRKFGKTDIIGFYEIEISLEGEVMGFKRLLLRERTDLREKTDLQTEN